MDRQDFITQEFLSIIASGNTARLDGFMACFFPGLTASRAMELIWRDVVDLSAFEEVAAAAWHVADESESRRRLLAIGLDAVECVLTGRALSYSPETYQAACYELHQAGQDNQAIETARRAMVKVTCATSPAVGKKRLLVARTELAALLLGGEW